MITLHAGESALPPRFRGILGFHLQDAKAGLQAIVHRVSLYPKWPGLSTTITSPPYHDLKDYEVKGQIGVGQTYTKYLDDLTDIFRLVYSLTSEHGSFWLVCNSFTVNGEVVLLPFDLAKKMRDAGWKLKEVIIWEKDRNLPWSNGRFRNVFEYVLLFSKSKLRFQSGAVTDFNPSNFQNWWIRYPERYSPSGITPTDVWKIAIPIQGSWRHSRMNHYHLCPFPVELVRRMLLLTTKPGDIVLDPFAGSGIVLATADCMGRAAIGFEIQGRYLERFRTAIKNEVKSEVERLQRAKSETQDFSNTILRLRLVKLPRILARSLRTQRSQYCRIRCVVAIERKRSKSAPAHALRGEDVFLVVDSTSWKNMDRMRSAAQRLLEVPPLSKYGIEAKVTVVPARQLSKIFSDYSKRTMWLYGTRSYSYAKRVRMDKSTCKLSVELLTAHVARNPPLLSSVKVDVPAPISIRF